MARSSGVGSPQHQRHDFLPKQEAAQESQHAQDSQPLDQPLVAEQLDRVAERGDDVVAEADAEAAIAAHSFMNTIGSGFFV